MVEVGVVRESSPSSMLSLSELLEPDDDEEDDDEVEDSLNIFTFFMDGGSTGSGVGLALERSGLIS